MFRRRKKIEEEIAEATEATQQSEKSIHRVEEKAKKVSRLYKILLDLREENHFSPRIRAAYEGTDRG